MRAMTHQKGDAVRMTLTLQIQVQNSDLWRRPRYIKGGRIIVIERCYESWEKEAFSNICFVFMRNYIMHKIFPMEGG